jgi:PAS domain S-box-containing protein
LEPESVEDLYDHAPCGYLSTTPDGTIVRVNQTLLNWTGHTREQLIGTRFQTLLTIGSRMYYETHYGPLLRMQGAANEIALEMVCADRRVLPIVANSTQRRDEDGTPRFNRITLFDSSDRRRYERELLLARRRAEQIAKDKADLLAMLSHDIRNPLNALMGVVHLLGKSDLSDGQRRQVDMVRSSSENMLELLNRVLALSKAEAVGFTLVERPFSMESVVSQITATFRARATEKRLQLKCHVDGAVPAMVMGDPVAVRQILANLIGNAIKFTETGEIKVSVTVKEAAVDAVTLAFVVSDTGIGIPADRLDKIFDEFTQGSYETAIKFGGTGLGLAIVRKLLSLYGSQVRVESELGKGTTFSFPLRLTVPAK